MHDGSFWFANALTLWVIVADLPTSNQTPRWAE